MSQPLFSAEEKDITPKAEQDSNMEENVTSPKVRGMQYKGGENTSIFKLANLSSDLIERMLSRVREAPGALSENERNKANEAWRFYKDDTGTIHVNLPANMEALADDWFAIVGLQAAVTLNAVLHVGEKQEEVLLPKYESYLQGIAGALRQGKKIKPLKASGQFAQGYNWIVSQTEFFTKHKEFFRTKWESPLVMLTGQKIWNKSPQGSRARWYNLVLLAAKSCDLTDYHDFLLSENELKKVFIKTNFHWENGSVFTPQERDSMKLDLAEELKVYHDVVSQLSEPNKLDILGFSKSIKEAKAPLLEYQKRLDTIATQRASIIYSPKMKKRYAKQALSLNDRIALLDNADLIRASNPTGILRSTERVVVTLKDQRAGPEEIVHELKKAYVKISAKDHLGLSWAKYTIEFYEQDIVDYDDAE